LLHNNLKAAQSNFAPSDELDTPQVVNRFFGITALYNKSIARSISERQLSDCSCLSEVVDTPLVKVSGYIQILKI
jgi:hypothetical protein